MTDGPTYDLFSLDQLEQLRDTYEARHDKQHANLVRDAINRKGEVQTRELSNCGKLFKHRHYDEETGRTWHTYTGDNMYWMKEYMSGPIIVRMDAGMFTGKNSEVGKAMMKKREAALRAAGLPTE
jgi:hypothetical protein